MLTALIIDDESNSRNALRQKLAKYCSDVNVVAECETGEEGIIAIKEKQPDLIFLDVEMPRVNGFTMLQQLPVRNFEVIFVTAYDQYAIKAIKSSALDYLVKPVEVEELQSAVAKAVQKRKQNDVNERLEALLQNLGNVKKDRQRIGIPSLEGFQFIELKDIIYFQASNNYTIIHRTDGTKIVASRTLKDFEDLLTPNYVRIHHAHIINCDKVDKYIRGEGGEVVMKNGAVLDVSKRKKTEFLRMISTIV